MSWPAFDGVLAVDGDALAEAAEDFGHLVRHRPAAVLRAGSVEDVSRIVRHARTAGLRLVPRGAGHTPYGQAAPYRCTHRTGAISWGPNGNGWWLRSDASSTPPGCSRGVRGPSRSDRSLLRHDPGGRLEPIQPAGLRRSGGYGTAAMV